MFIFKNYKFKSFKNIKLLGSIKNIEPKSAYKYLKNSTYKLFLYSISSYYKALSSLKFISSLYNNILIIY